MRLFVALEVSESIIQQIGLLQKKIAQITDKIRPVALKNMHITLKFLGEQLPQAVDRIAEIINDNVNKKPVAIRLDKAGVFKNLKHPQVLWLGEENKQFEDFALKLSNELDVFRPSDNKPFCHLTIGRMKYIKQKDLLDVLKLCRDFVSENNLNFVADSIGLFESRLKKSGAEYRLIKKFNFKG
ncbi:RNA 2',3'-cyclic phosphodiesterase [Hippea jasoniae]|uniref:RNA 2',3'-cyclic phosphodiesterase n=1 Tax=Hippea jasoniae TaxID=944479 RepID=UPI000556E628|nr:RNA 2',3'-cyclic phosphodiesterase [Hippea jasoniae]